MYVKVINSGSRWRERSEWCGPLCTGETAAHFAYKTKCFSSHLGCNVQEAATRAMNS